MRIVMFTNTYLPHVGGVARSVSTFEEEFRRRGHEVRIVAPRFDGGEKSTDCVLRAPAIQRFNGSDFSVRIPVPGLLADFVDDFRPDILHSHHPFLLGDAALRMAWSRRLPLVFTFHTMYEQYTHYVPLDSDAIKRFAIQMATDYCNLCSHVVAPSESVARLIVERGVKTQVTAVPTGIDVQKFAGGDRERFRRQFEIDGSALVIGHVGRLAPEKNLEFLARAVARFLADRPDALLLVVGTGKSERAMQQAVAQLARPEQLILAGQKSGQDLVDAYAAMDVFAFTSQSETQGMVLAEAMAAGVPAVALDGPGVREIVCEKNGRLLAGDASEEEFAAALAEVADDPQHRKQFREASRQTAQRFSVENCADRLLGVYERLIDEFAPGHAADPDPWDRLLGRLEIEWNLLVEKTSALMAATREDEAAKARLE